MVRILFFTPFFAATLAFAQPIKIDLKSPTAILINAETGKVLYEKNAYVSRFPASTTKIATALYLLEKKSGCLDEVAQVSANAVKIVNAHVRQSHIEAYPAYQMEHDGIQLGLKAGEKLTLRTLLYGLLVRSANDTGNVIAEHISGDIDLFMKEVNQYLLEKGIKNTTFYNPHGFYYPNHKTTAYDLAKMAQIGMKNPIFRQVVGTVSFEKPETNKNPAATIFNNNRLIRPGKYFYPKATGIKTGYTASSGCNIVASAVHEGRELIAVIMGSANSEERFKDVVALFEKAFSEGKVSRKLFTKDYDAFSQNIEGAEVPLKAKLMDDLFLTYFPSEEPDFDVSVSWKGLSFPIREGEEVGFVTLLTKDGKALLKKPIFSIQDIKGTFSYRFKSQLDAFWHRYKVIVGLLVFVNAIGLGFFFTIGKKRKQSS